MKKKKLLKLFWVKEKNNFCQINKINKIILIIHSALQSNAYVFFKMKFQNEKFKTFFLKNKKITVMGLGLNQGGLGVVKFLVQNGAQVLVTDLKKKKELAESIKILNKLKNPNIKYILGRHRKQDFVNTDMIIQNPAVPYNSEYLKIARAHNIPIETDIGLFLKFCPSLKIIAIAGTKGKSTVSVLIYQILKKAKKDVVLAGNIGVSVLEVLPKIQPKTIVILEISSWQLEGVQKHYFSPWISVLTNILPDHLDRYSNFQKYIEAEKMVFKYQNKKNFLVLNYDNKITRHCVKECQAQIIKFSLKNPQKNIFNFKKFLNVLKILGNHNKENVLAAITVVKLVGVKQKDIIKGIENFKGLPHRLEFIRQLRGVKFYNDSAATTPEACLAAVNSFKSSIILILGGKDKQMCFKELVKKISKSKKIKKVILLEHLAYDASKKILKEFKKLLAIDKVICVSSLKQAVKQAYKKASKRDIILLSPAAASFGMFKNEFDRGEKFIRVVNNLN